MGEGPSKRPDRVAFYDFDGTLVSGNVVTRYAWLARHHPNPVQAAWRFGKTVLGIPFWLALDAVSRRMFNVVFFRQYRGLEQAWLRAKAREMFQTAIKREQFRYAKERVALDRKAGYLTVLVSGGLDFELAPAAEYFEFDDMLANRMEFHGGVATGTIIPPLLAGEVKAAELKAYAAAHGFDMSQARAYSDSGSDIPMLQVVGAPIATNPDSRLRKVAVANRWDVVDLNESPIPIRPGESV